MPDDLEKKVAEFKITIHFNSVFGMADRWNDAEVIAFARQVRSETAEECAKSFDAMHNFEAGEFLRKKFGSE